MPEIIEKALGKVNFIQHPGLEDLIWTNNETRRITKLLTENKN
jgi:1-deoxy-D-xylulose-5-phosphate reductoisomerase